jgi:hypothetical protein
LDLFPGFASESLDISDADFLGFFHCLGELDYVSDG